MALTASELLHQAEQQRRTILARTFSPPSHFRILPDDYSTLCSYVAMHFQPEGVALFAGEPALFGIPLVVTDDIDPLNRGDPPPSWAGYRGRRQP